jgi:hypothetical protein
MLVPALLACSSRGALPLPRPEPGAPADAAAAGSPSATCSRLTNRPPAELALIGQDGSDLVLVANDGTVRRVPGPGAQMIYQQRGGWVAAYDTGHPGTWHVQLFDAAGGLHADAAGAAPLNSRGQPTGIAGLAILSDGMTTVNLGAAGDAPVLLPDGRTLMRPFFSTDPDARGWVGATLSNGQVVGEPVLLNVETGETRHLTYLTAGDTWAPIISGARRLYLTEQDGEAVLVDESVDGAVTRLLPGWPRASLEIDTQELTDGTVAAYVSLSDGTRRNVPIWLYDLETQSLSTVLPDGALPEQAYGLPGSNGLLDVRTPGLPAGIPAWRVDLVSGTIFDFRTGTARTTKPTGTGPARWFIVADSQTRLYRLDSAHGVLQDLHLTGDVAVSGTRALVTVEDRPRAIVGIDDGAVTPVPGGEALPSAFAVLVGRWATGFDGAGRAGWIAGSPRWRVDLDSGEARVFAPSATTDALMGNQAATPLNALGAPLLPDGRLGMLLDDGLGFRLYLRTPDAPWHPIGETVRAAQEIHWGGNDGFVIAAERSCDCYGGINIAWPTPPAGAVALSGTSLQFIGGDGQTIFPATTDEHLVSFADEDQSCALVRSDAGEWAVYDLPARRRIALGKLDALAWARRAP